MDLSGPGTTYIFLMIPTLFALTVVGQGVSKISHGDKDGKLVLGFGAMFLMLVAGTYFFFIR